MNGKLVSPNELIQAAKEQMLDGREPSTTKDYALIINFCAVNVPPEIAESVCVLIRSMYNMPIDEDYVKRIVQFQLKTEN
jgi:hypothetical protein